MTRTRIIRRLQNAEAALDSLPVKQANVDRALVVFRETGVLPQRQDVAAQVVDRALQAGRERVDLMTGIARLKAIADAVEAGDELPPEPDRCRRQLFYEAVYGTEDHREAAREALVRQADDGVDVTSSAFLRDEPLPTFGTVGLHLTGYYVRIADQPGGRELLSRWEALCREHAHDAEWFAAIEAASVQTEPGADTPCDAADRDLLAGLLQLADEFTGSPRA